MVDQMNKWKCKMMRGRQITEYNNKKYKNKLVDLLIT